MTNLPNQITIEGETYVKNNCTWHKFPLSSTCLACQAGQPTIEEPKEWPQELDRFWYVDNIGKVLFDYYWKEPEHVTKMRKRGNFFKTEEEAKMYSLRIESLSKGFMPEDNEIFWFWNFQYSEIWDGGGGKVFLLNPKFRTKEECQAWYDEYGKAWEYLLKLKQNTQEITGSGGSREVEDATGSGGGVLWGDMTFL